MNLGHILTDSKHKSDFEALSKWENGNKQVKHVIPSTLTNDLGDLKNTMNRGGKRFYITFIDEYSKYTRVYLLRNKDEVMDALIKYKNEVENQLSKKIKRLRSNRGVEYESNPVKTFCEGHGIIHETTPPYSPKSKGVAERKNITLKEMMNVMLVSSKASLNL